LKEKRPSFFNKTFRNPPCAESSEYPFQNTKNEINNINAPPARIEEALVKLVL